MTAGYLVFLVVGRAIIFIANKFASQNIKIEFLNKLLSCVLCSGIWVYTILSFLAHYYVLLDWMNYIPFVSEFVTGVVSAILVYYIGVGWEAIHKVVII